MAKNRNVFSPAAGLFEQNEEKQAAVVHQISTEKNSGASAVSKIKPGKKENVTIYLTPEEHINLNEQTGIGKKERFNVALARAGLDIVLALETEQYFTLKNIASQQNKTLGEIIKQAVEQYLN